MWAPLALVTVVSADAGKVALDESLLLEQAMSALESATADHFARGMGSLALRGLRRGIADPRAPSTSSRDSVPLVKPPVKMRPAVSAWLCTVGAALIVTSCRAPLPAAPLSEEGTVNRPKCVATWSIDHASSVLSEQRMRGTYHDDFFVRYESEPITTAHLPIDALRRFSLDGSPIFFLQPDKASVVVDARFSSALATADMTSLAPGTRAVLGRLTPRAMSLAPLDLVDLLVRADVLRTYAHIGSEVCVLGAAKSAGAIKADVRGEHTYVTHHEHHAAFAFHLDVAPDGELSVVGVAP